MSAGLLSQYPTLFAAIAPVFAVIGIGFVLREANWLSFESDRTLLRLVVNILYPCLILDSILGKPELRNFSNVALAPGVGFLTVIFGYAVALFVASRLRMKDAAERRTFGFATGIYNYGYIPIPLIHALFGNDGTTGVLFVHNVGVEIALWTVGMLVLTGASLRDGWRKVFNVPVVAILAAITLNFFNGRNWIPSPLLTTANLLGNAAIPLGLIVSGAAFSDVLRVTRLRSGAKTAIAGCSLRLVLIPIFFLLLARYLPCPVELKRVIVVQAAMPSAIIPIILAKHYGGDAATALRVVLSTTIVSLLTIPCWIHLGLRFAGI